MDYYKAATLIKLSAGTVVALTKEQAERRAHRVTEDEKKKGTYLLNESLQFKAGELIGIEGGPPKPLWRDMAGGENGDPPTVFDADGKAVKQPPRKGAKEAAKKGDKD